MINNPLGVKADFVPGVKNVLANAISRTYSNSTSPPSFINLFKEFRDVILGDIPPESRVALAHLLRVVKGSRTRFISFKDSGTLISRQLHFMEFIKTMKLGNNVALTGFTTLTRNAIMACYVVHLAAGNNLLCKSIISRDV